MTYSTADLATKKTLQRLKVKNYLYELLQQHHLFSNTAKAKAMPAMSIQRSYLNQCPNDTTLKHFNFLAHLAFISISEITSFQVPNKTEINPFLLTYW